MITEGNELDSVKPCSTVLDAGDSVTAVGISRVLTPDGRYCWFSVMSFCVESQISIYPFSQLVS